MGFFPQSRAGENPSVVYKILVHLQSRSIIDVVNLAFRNIVALAVVALVVPCAKAQPGPATVRPNVLLIIVDDLNTSLGCYGSAVVKSPNVDRLAKAGMRFDRAYSHYPICNPSRTSLLSGRRPDTTGVLDNETPARKYLKDVLFLPEYFQQHGYFTARVGKIAHGAFNQDVKWDVSLDPPKAPSVRLEQNTWQATNNRDEDEPDGTTAPRVVQVLETRREKPFFVAVGFDKPHLPFVAPKKYFDLYPLEQIPLPNEPADVRKGVPSVAFPWSTGSWRNETEQRQTIGAYYACISFIDAQMGIVLNAIDRLGFADTTVVCFTSDHGFHLGEHRGLWRKSTLFEESARVPLIIRLPQMRGGQVCARVVEHIDLFPTLVQLCGLQAPAGLEGRSLVPLLAEPSMAWDKAAITFLVRERLLENVLGESLRTERWRYTEWNQGKRGVELYDHDRDPREFVNLAKNPQYAQTVAELKALLHRTVKQPEVKQPVTQRVIIISFIVLLLVFIVWRTVRRRAKADLSKT
jgi:iduronate 2-sulfatase